MKRAPWFCIVASAVCVAGAISGCAVDPQQRALCDPAQHRLAMAQTYHNYFDEAAGNAVVRQATVFPHHFEPRTAHLTELGRHELGILAMYLRTSPGEIRMPRGTADDTLYAARSDAVMAFLREHEVNVDAVKVVNLQPDGDGMASYRVVEALAAENVENKGESNAIGIPTIRQGRSNASSSIRSSK